MPKNRMCRSRSASPLRESFKLELVQGGSASPQTMTVARPTPQNIRCPAPLAPRVEDNLLHLTASSPAESEKIVRILLAASGANQIQARECAARRIAYDKNSRRPRNARTKRNEVNEG